MTVHHLVVIHLLLLIITTCWKVGAQIAGAARMQPILSQISTTKTCCGLLEGQIDVTALLTCVNGTESAQASFTLNNNGKKVALLTYMSPEEDLAKHFAVPDIVEFGVYHAANVAIYAEQNNMMYRIATAAVGGNNEPADVRWNKVKLLIDALDPHSGWAKNVEFIVWIDADAIVLDLGFSIESVGEQFPHAHFLASADIRQGYINSGFLILRNSEWTRRFLQDWWEVSDRREVCDQDAFDAIYTQYVVREQEQRRRRAKLGQTAQTVGEPDTTRIEERVRILRRDALNSDPPATLRQRPHNQVLHLMGESTRVRRELFRSAFQTACGAALAEEEDDRYVPSQLGLSQSRMYEKALRIYQEETSERLEHLRRLIEGLTFPSAQAYDPGEAESLESSLELIKRAPLLFEGLGKASHHYSDLQTKGGGLAGEDDEVLGVLTLRRDLFDLCMRWLESTSAFLNGINAKLQEIDRVGEDRTTAMAETAMLKQRRSQGVDSFLQMLKRGAEMGNDLFGVITVDSYFAPSKGEDEKEDEEDEEGEEDVVPRDVWAKQKLIVAEKVFALLRELDARVSEESKHVPRHMQALMHQNVAYLHYGVSNLFLPAASAGGETSTSVGEQVPHPKDILTAAQMQQLRDYHLFQAEQHALSSVSLFDTTFSHGRRADRSTNEEHVLSLQILAAVCCTDSRNLTTGLQTWERTIAKARDNLQGVSIGKPLERLADIYHNAAVCHMHTALDPALSDSGLHTGLVNPERVFERARTLVAKAVEARAQIVKACAVPASGAFTPPPTVPAHRPSDYAASGARVIGLDDDINKGAPPSAGVKTRHVGDDSEEARLLGLSEDLARTLSQKYHVWKAGRSKGTSENDPPPRYLSELDEDEWEECEPGEEGCEAFVVDVEPERGHTPSIAEDDGVDADVEEARRHYAAQMAFLDL